ncbi:MAG: ABC transporter permease [Candidatus Nanopelagicales bacterium]|nr:ABC transporter permease [Candidatus Nanopelagicales bacterium]
MIDPDTGLRLAQYTTPVFAVFATCMACYASLAIAVSYARASGVLKRLRGTPLPPTLHVVGRISSSVWVSVLAVAIMIGVGVGFYGVQVIWENVPALVLTFVVGAACFSALGLAVASVAPTPNAANAFANASLILLSFISGVFGFGDLPAWMDRVASVFPLKHFVDAFSAGFNPYEDASTPDWGSLAVMTVWGILGAVIVWRAFGWEPRSGRILLRGRRGRSAPGEVDVEEPAEVEGGVSGRTSAPAVGALAGGGALAGTDTVTTPGPPGVVGVVWQQTRYALLQMVRDPMSLFFSVIFPVLLVSFFSSIYGEEAQWGGLRLAQYLAAAFAVYGVATAGLVNIPGSIAEHRAQRILKRLRGTPVPPWAYITGRILAVWLLGLLTVVLVFAVAVTFFSVTLPPSTWAATLLAFTLAICCFAACGMAIVTGVDGVQTVIAVSLSILLPLSFISDIFISIEEMPTVLNAIGWFFPLRHSVHAAVTATSGGALDATFWGHLAVITVWMVGTGLVAWRWFRWEPRQARSSN